MKFEVDLDLPPELLDQIPASEISTLCRSEIILRLFNADKIGSGEAARLLGLTRLEFLDLLRQRGMALRVELTAEDFRQLHELRKRYSPNAS
jgi:predicted HTH domain antitoxin